MEITIATSQADMDDVGTMLSDPQNAKRTVVVFPSDARGDLPWQVVDNRTGDAWVEDFDTLDGALAYAVDLRTTCDEQEKWDIHGHLHDELVQLIKD